MINTFARKAYTSLDEYLLLKQVIQLLEYQSI